MGVWGEGPLDNDTAGDLSVFWEQFVSRGRAKDPKFWSAARIAELFRFLYFRGFDEIRPDKADQAEQLLALGALFLRANLLLPKDLKALVEAAINYELRTSRLQEWAEPSKRKIALEQFLGDIGGKRQRPSKVKKRPAAKDIVEIEAFMKRARHWIAVVKFEAPYDRAYDKSEPAFVSELKRFCFAGTRSDDQREERRAIVARLMCLGYVAGWMLNLPSDEILRLVEAAPQVTSPAGPIYAWAAQAFAS